MPAARFLGPSLSTNSGQRIFSRPEDRDWRTRRDGRDTRPREPLAASMPSVCALAAYIPQADRQPRRRGGSPPSGCDLDLALRAGQRVDMDWDGQGCPNRIGGLGYDNTLLEIGSDDQVMWTHASLVRHWFTTEVDHESGGIWPLLDR
jgi:hypothetical protein